MTHTNLQQIMGRLIKMKKVLRTYTLLLFSLMITLTGCMGTSKEMGHKQPAPKAKSNINKVTYHHDNRTNRVTKTGTNYRLADHVAKKVKHLKEVNTVSALVSGNKAYVAVTLRGHHANTKMTKKIEHTISKQAKKADPHLRHVYVSTNPDFVGHMNQYMHQVRNGHPIQGFTKNFSDMVHRTFPTAK